MESNYDKECNRVERAAAKAGYTAISIGPVLRNGKHWWKVTAKNSACNNVCVLLGEGRGSHTALMQALEYLSE